MTLCIVVLSIHSFQVTFPFFFFFFFFLETSLQDWCRPHEAANSGTGPNLLAYVSFIPILFLFVFGRN